MKKVKNIIFKMSIKGNGIVNYDSSEQKWMINRTNLGHMKTRHDNTSFAKKRFYGTPEDTNYKLTISSDCLRHEIFGGDAPFHSPNVIQIEGLLMAHIASPTALLRGYFFTERSNASFKRKSPLTIVAAEQTNDAVSYIETFTSSAAKNSDKDKETADNTFYKKEVVGKIEYETEGFIDVMGLQFVSCDQVFDRYAFNPDSFDLYKSLMKPRLSSFDPELGYYQIKNSINEIPEYGFKLSNDNMNELIRSLFQKMLSMSIKRKDAYAQTAALQYKLVYDVIEDTIDSEDGWVSIDSELDIATMKFDFEDFYVPVDAEKANQQRQDLVNEYERLKEKAREDKKSKKSKTKNDE